MPDEKNKQLFYSLVYSLQMQTMIQLGKLANPMSGKVEKELEAAQMTIDMLDMLKLKTANNLDDDEKNFLTHALADLKLNFVEEKTTDNKSGSQGGDTQPKSPDGSADSQQEEQS